MILKISRKGLTQLPQIKAIVLSLTVQKYAVLSSNMVFVNLSQIFYHQFFFLFTIQVRCWWLSKEKVINTIKIFIMHVLLLYSKDVLVIIVQEIKNKQLLGIKYALQVCKGS